MKLSILLLSIASGCAVPADVDAVARAQPMGPDAGAMPMPIPADAPTAPAPHDAATDAATGPTKVTTTNVPTTIDVLSIFPSPSKPTQITAVGALTATLVDPFPLPPNGSTNTAGGSCVTVSNIPAGYLVGSGGAEGCIIAVVVRCDGTVVSCHFTATDDAAATLAKLAPFGDCAHAGLAGGTNQGPSNETLAGAIAGLKRNKVKIDGMLDRSGLYWDATNGRWVYGKNDKVSNNTP